MKWPNDPKLSDGGGLAADVPVGSAGLPHSGCQTGAVRWSAWLGDVGFPIVIEDHGPNGVTWSLVFGGPHSHESRWVDIPSEDVWRLYYLIMRIDPNSLERAKQEESKRLTQILPDQMSQSLRLSLGPDWQAEESGEPSSLRLESNPKHDSEESHP